MGGSQPSTLLNGVTLPPNFSWVQDGRIAGCGLPQNKEEIQGLVKVNVGIIVNMTEVEISPGLINTGYQFPNDILLFAQQLQLLHVPTLDGESPPNEQLDMICARMGMVINSGKAAVVHCFKGEGRTGTVLACFLVKNGMSAVEAINFVRQKRARSLHTVQQENAVKSYEHFVRNANQRMLSGSEPFPIMLDGRMVLVKIVDPAETPRPGPPPATERTPSGSQPDGLPSNIQSPVSTPIKFGNIPNTPNNSLNSNPGFLSQSGNGIIGAGPKQLQSVDEKPISSPAPTLFPILPAPPPTANFPSPGKMKPAEPASPIPNVLDASQIASLQPTSIQTPRTMMTPSSLPSTPMNMLQNHMNAPQGVIFTPPPQSYPSPARQESFRSPQRDGYPSSSPQGLIASGQMLVSPQPSQPFISVQPPSVVNNTGQVHVAAAASGMFPSPFPGAAGPQQPHSSSGIGLGTGVYSSPTAAGAPFGRHISPARGIEDQNVFKNGAGLFASPPPKVGLGDQRPYYNGCLGGGPYTGFNKPIASPQGNQFGTGNESHGMFNPHAQKLSPDSILIANYLSPGALESFSVDLHSPKVDPQSQDWHWRRGGSDGNDHYSAPFTEHQSSWCNNNYSSPTRQPLFSEGIPDQPFPNQDWNGLFPDNRRMQQLPDMNQYPQAMLYSNRMSPPKQWR